MTSFLVLMAPAPYRRGGPVVGAPGGVSASMAGVDPVTIAIAIAIVVAVLTAVIAAVAFFFVVMMGDETD